MTWRDLLLYQGTDWLLARMTLCRPCTRAARIGSTLGSHYPILEVCFGPWNEPAAVGLFPRLVEPLGYEYDPRFTWVATALFAIGILIAVWWCRWRRRAEVAWICPRCTYDLRGVARDPVFPFRCAECGLEIESERPLTKTRRGWKLLGIAVLVFAAAHFTALWPQVKREGWMRIVPATVLVLQPMDVAQWTKARARWRYRTGELNRRLNDGELWSWQEWILFKRVEHACRARDDYGITPLQYKMAVKLHTTPARARDEETLARRLARLSASVDVPFVIDWASLSQDGFREDELVRPAPTDATAADALEELFTWPYELWWNITPEGVVVAGRSQAGSTARVRIYEVSDFRDESSVDELIDLMHMIEPESWVDFGGTANAGFGISDHLVIIAPARVHFEIEDLLENLRQAGAAEAAMPGMLGHLRRLRTIGRCPRCWYPMGESAVCTDCGGELPKRARTP